MPSIDPMISPGLSRAPDQPPSAAKFFSSNSSVWRIGRHPQGRGRTLSASSFPPAGDRTSGQSHKPWRLYRHTHAMPPRCILSSAEDLHPRWVATGLSADHAAAPRAPIDPWAVSPLPTTPSLFQHMRGAKCPASCPILRYTCGRSRTQLQSPRNTDVVNGIQRAGSKVA